MKTLNGAVSGVNASGVNNAHHELEGNIVHMLQGTVATERGHKVKRTRDASRGWSW